MFTKQDKHDLSFSSRAEAFNYMLNYLVNEKGVDPLEAVDKADKFADLFAKNAGLPDKVIPEPKGIDRYISYAEKIGSYLESHPKVIEVAVPAITFIAGLFTGNKIEQHEKQEYHSVREEFEKPIQEDEIID